jgi:drug/metabolite transporter (DMT)-like permease
MILSGKESNKKSPKRAQVGAFGCMWKPIGCASAHLPQLQCYYQPALHYRSLPCSTFRPPSARRRKRTRLLQARDEERDSELELDFGGFYHSSLLAPATDADETEGGSRAGDVSPQEASTNVAVGNEAPARAVALLILNCVAVLWGTQHAVLRHLLSDEGDTGEQLISPGLLNFIRFSIAALSFSPWTPGMLASPPQLPFTASDGECNAALTAEEVQSTWLAGAELGLWMFLGFALQAVGLQYTSASRSAFLLYLNVKIVPFLGAALFVRSVGVDTWVSAAAALIGCYLLSSDGSPPNVGDAWCVGAAVASAMFILRLDSSASRCDAAALNSATLWVTASLCAVWASQEPGISSSMIAHIGDKLPGICYLAICTTALTNWLQNIGQRSIPAEQAALIYAMDAPYAAIFAHFFIGEELGVRGIVGAVIITAAALGSQVWNTWAAPKLRKPTDSKEVRQGNCSSSLTKREE